jgi:hypothetical protein
MADEAWLDTVRFARDMGTVSELVPAWSDGLRDLPWLMFEAIRVALVLLSFESLPDNEQPPKRIWLDGQRLEEWFRQVKRRRDERTGDSGEIEDPVENPAAKALLVG